MTSTASTFNGPRRSTFSTNREPVYWCLNCRIQRWRSGGATELGLHQAAHGGAVSFPTFELVDESGFILDFDGVRLRRDGKHVHASTTVTGWVRTRPHINRVASDREGR
ncbi:MAG: hypothetical protein ACRD0P_06340 [Stackebrandtia sp.]